MADPQIIEQLKSDMKTAMKAREKLRLQTIRSLLASLKNAQIAKQADLDDEDVLAVLATESKRRRESHEAFAGAGRTDLAEQEAAELEVIQQYLPAQLSDEEVKEMIDEVIARTGASSKADMGKVMGQLMPQLKGRFDGSRVKDLVLAKL